jgi:aspartyl-tRNA(Asn)/glutamyl-tRNA(Gln) amidotransferase subunit A
VPQSGGCAGGNPLIPNTVPFNALGIPTISVPCGFSGSGLPIGFQIAGPRLGEARVFALARMHINMRRNGIDASRYWAEAVDSNTVQ